MRIGLTGGMVSGKRTIAQMLLEKGFYALTFSDAINDELRKKGIPITRKSQQDLGNEIRNEKGPGEWAKRLIEKMEPGKNYVVDGIRNPGEISELRKQKDFFLLAVDSSQKKRFERIIARAMDRDPKTWEEFLKADARDFSEENPNGLQIAKCMEMADYVIQNNNGEEELKKKVELVLERINKS